MEKGREAKRANILPFSHPGDEMYHTPSDEFRSGFSRQRGAIYMLSIMEKDLDEIFPTLPLLAVSLPPPLYRYIVSEKNRLDNPLEIRPSRTCVILRSKYVTEMGLNYEWWDGKKKGEGGGVEGRSLSTCQNLLDIFRSYHQPCIISMGHILPFCKQVHTARIAIGVLRFWVSNDCGCWTCLLEYK